MTHRRHEGIALKGILFDLDGTLTDTLPLCHAAFIEVFQQFTGRTYTAAEIHALFGPSEEGVIKRVVPDQWEECLAAYLQVYEREHPRLACIFPGVKVMLDRLREDSVRLAIVSSKGGGSGTITLRLLGLEHYAEAVHWGTPEGGRKPAAIREVLQKWEYSPAQAAYVGDAPSDMRAARDVGVLGLGAAWSNGVDPERLRESGAVRAFRSPAELDAWLAGVLRPETPHS